MPPKKIGVIEEPIEAQPPEGIVLEEPILTEASDVEMAALRAAALSLAPVIKTDVQVEIDAVILKHEVKFGDFVSFVLDANTIQRIKDTKVSTESLCLGDVVLGLVISEDTGNGVTLRLFVDTDVVPVVRGVKGFNRPTEVTLNHCGMYFV